MLAFLAKIMICSSLFCGLYHFLLRKETYFHLNRIYLLAGLLLSVFIPALHISIGIQESAPESLFYSFVNGTKELFLVYILDEVVIYGKASPFTWANILEKIYLIGIFVFSLRIPVFLYQLIKLHLNSRKYKINGISLYVHHEPYVAFSFGRSIYVNKEELEAPDFKTIWKHELQHIKFGHTVESFFLELWCCAFWFNPFVWMSKNRLKELHEFQVDNKLISEGLDVIAYQKHLVNYALAGNAFTASSNFAAIAIKRRVQMLSSKRSSLGRHIRLLAILPLLLLLTSAFAFDFSIAPTPPTPPTPPEIITPIDTLTQDSISILRAEKSN